MRISIIIIKHDADSDSMRREDWPEIINIHKIRRQLGLSQSDLSVKSGVAQPIISRIEYGIISHPSYEVVRRIFNAFQDEESNLMGAHTPTASDLLEPNVESVKPGDLVAQAWQKMKNGNFSQLPVLDDHGAIRGSISYSSFPSDNMIYLGRKKVEEIMEDGFPTVGMRVRMPTIASLLKTEPAVLVLDKGKIAGIITSYDLMTKWSEI
jgi:predicted transcriptional regulator